MRTKQEIEERIADSKRSRPKTDPQRVMQAFEIGMLHWFLGDDQPCSECCNRADAIARRMKLTVVK